MGGGGGLGLFVGTVGSRGTDAFAGGRLIAAVLGNTATDAGGGMASAEAVLPQEVRDAVRLLERPLDHFILKEAARLKGTHRQFIFENGDNFGKMADGSIRADTPENMNKYTPKDPRTFKGKYIREAQRQLESERRAVESMYENIKNLPLSDNMPHNIPAYNFLIDNCINYAKNIVHRAEKIAKKAGDTLTY